MICFVIANHENVFNGIRLSDRDCLDGRRVDSSLAQVAKTLLY